MSKNKFNPMLDLFFIEAQGQLSVMNESLAALRNDTKNENELDSLLRASSSLKTAAKLTSIDAIFTLAQLQETLFTSAAQKKLTITAAQIKTLQSAVNLILPLINNDKKDIDSWLQENEKQLSTIIKKLTSFTQTKAETTEKSEKNNASVESQVKNTNLADLSMMELFRMESETQMRSLNESLLELENSPNNLKLIERLMRAAHSIKGAARMVGLNEAVNVAHKMEDIFVAAQNSKLEITHEDMDILLACVDIISSMAEATSHDYKIWITKNTTKINEASEALNSILKGEEKPVLTFISKDKPGNKATPDSSTSLSESSNTATESATAKDSAENSVRVSTSSLNRLQGLSGEALVETRWLTPFSDSLLQIKKRQAELVSVLDSLREKLFDIEIDEYTEDLLLNAHHKANHCRDLLSERLSELEAYDRRSYSLSHRLNREVLQARMRPFADGVQGLQRLARDVARSLNKKINLDIRGLATQVDRDILEKLQAPLNHMIRNAIDHGIEMPDERIKAGKNATGTIRLEAMHNAGMLSIIIQDDGDGIDMQNLRKKVIEKGLVTAEMAENLSETELLDFMFLPNFSTREAVTEISGRGVGLDVVHSVMQELRGQIRASSKFGQGLKFQLQLPLTLSVVRALMVDIAGEPYAFPLARIDQTIKISKQNIETMEGRQYFTYGNRPVGLITIHQVLELADKPSFSDEISVVILGDRINSYGLVVDKFLGERNLIVHKLDPRLGKIQDISSASLTEDGTPLLIFDVDDLLRSIDILLSGGRLNKLGKSEQDIQSITSKRVLIVDDSITVREVERNLLQSKGYQVEVAVDGMDGWNAARTSNYDLIVSDIDMPRMNGFEFVSLIKSDERFRNIPVIIVSYKDRDEDRQRGLEVGADYYLTKGSFHDDSLVDAVVELIGEA